MMKLTTGGADTTTIMHLHDSNTNSSDQSSYCFEDESEGMATPRNNEKGGAGEAHEDSDEDAADALAEPETIAVRILRVITLMVMVGATIAVGVFVYLYMKHDEEETMENNFYDLAHRLMAGFHANAALRVQTLDMFGISLTSSAIATNQTWPLVVIDDFEARATAARAIVKSEYIGISPYVSLETKKDWEYFTTLNTHWLNESYAFQEDFKSVHNRTVGNRAPARALRGMSLEEGDFLSRWLQEEAQQEELQVAELDDVSYNDALATTTEVRNVTFDGPDGIPTEIYRYGTEEEGFLFVYDDGQGPYYPIWQVSPTREYSAIDVNYNLADDYYSGAFSDAPETVRTTQTAIFGGVWNVDETGYIDENDDYDFRTVPAASLIYPVFDKLVGEKDVVAVLDLDIEFGPLFSSVLPSNSNRLVCVVRNTCNQIYTFEVTGEMATYLGAEDLHDENFDHMMVSALLTDFQHTTETTYNGPPVNEDFCPWVIGVYGTQDLYDAHITSRPIYYMCAVLGIFLFTCLTFCLYDCLVEHRQRKVSTAAKRSEKIVSSLFPKNFRDKLYENNRQKSMAARAKAQTTPKSFQTSHVQDFLSGGSKHTEQLPHPGSHDSIANSPPMAELYPNCTVFFADVAGFTAWSSARSPTEVFTLLETIYGAFDKLAAMHRVFKIETIGDCYVAVTGLPVAQPNHALQMVKFSRDVHVKMKKLTQQLESTLGPDTGDLSMRVGLHSGPVTAGILRGEKARFQLFGDTVNTAARMESNGRRELIHVSKQTADILIQQGKGHWVHARPEKIQAKGKGELQTYFVKPTSGAGSVASAMSSSDGGSLFDQLEDAEDVELALADFEGTEEEKGQWAKNNCRRIAWVSDLLKEELKRMVSQRKAKVDPKAWKNWQGGSHVNQDFVWDDDIYKALLSSSEEGGGGSLSVDVERQVFEFVSQIAYSYQNVPYHSFEHACVTLMSVDKMLKQIPSMFEFGLTLSPWAKFACLLSTLIRNMDPPDVPDIDPQASPIVKSRSAAGLTSTARTMHLLQNSRFHQLRETLCATKPEFRRFWNLVQNLILATDTSAGSLSAHRNQRWEASFGSAMHHNKSGASPEEKVVPVLEHITLMAQESHAVQHWENFVKWNDLLLQEYREQHQMGRLPVNPVPIWHQNQIYYFDTFVIPLTQKIDQAGVLGAIGGEFFMYACQNRQEMASGMHGANKPAPFKLTTNSFNPGAFAQHGTSSSAPEAAPSAMHGGNKPAPLQLNTNSFNTGAFAQHGTSLFAPEAGPYYFSSAAEKSWADQFEEIVEV